VAGFAKMGGWFDLNGPKVAGFTITPPRTILVHYMDKIAEGKT